MWEEREEEELFTSCLHLKIEPWQGFLKYNSEVKKKVFAKQHWQSHEMRVKIFIVSTLNSSRYRIHDLVEQMLQQWFGDFRIIGSLMKG